MTATPKQIAFITRLADERGKADTITAEFAATLSKGMASDLITDLLAMPRVAKAEAPKPAAPTVGPKELHFAGGQFVKTVESKAGRVYGKVAGFTVYGPEDVRVRWDYAPGAVHGLSADTKVTAQIAAAFGALTASCVFCSQPLSTPESVSMGYGPTCAKRHGLPWGEVVEVTAEAHALVAEAIGVAVALPEEANPDEFDVLLTRYARAYEVDKARAFDEVQAMDWDELRAAVVRAENESAGLPA